jgi:ligand-binding sensor domain-containing protein
MGIAILLILPLQSQQLYFRHYFPGEEFKGIQFNLVYEDINELMWFGTSEGMFSFNGSEFTNYSPKPEASVTAIYQDSTKRYWIGLEDGGIYQFDRGEFDPWMIEEGWPKKKIVDFAMAPDSTLYIATYGEGLYYYKSGRLYNINADDGLLSNDIYSMILDPGGRIWTATDAGINIVYGKKEKKIVENITKKDGLEDEIINELFLGDDDLWVGSFDLGFCNIDPETKSINHPKQDWNFGVIHAIDAFAQHEIFLGTGNQGLFRYHTQSGDITQIPVHGLQNAQIVDLHTDREGNIWVVDKHNGVFIAHRQFEFIKPGVPSIQAMLFDSEDRLIAGNQEGLYRISGIGGENSVETIIPEKINVMSLFLDHHEYLWVGTFGQGLYYLDLSSGRYEVFHKENGLTDESILSITGDGEKIWLATLGGVTEIDHTENPWDVSLLNTTNYNLADGLGTNFIYTAKIDQKERIWFGTDGKGLSMLEKGRLTNFPSIDSIDLHAIYSITVDLDERIWFSTDRQGVFNYDGQKFNRLSLKEGIRDLEISNVIADRQGNILLAHPTGIDVLGTNEMFINYYGQEVGIEDFVPNFNANALDKEGCVWIAGQTGLVKFTGLSGKVRNYPQNYLNLVSIFLDPIDHNSEHRFSHSKNYLTFDFKGLWYTNPEMVRYRYKLEGLDPDWKYTKENTVTYPNLPAGDFRFLVQSTSNDQFNVQNEIYYDFQIKKAFYQTHLFILLAILITGLLIRTFIKIREQRLSRVAMMKKEQIQLQFETLKSQINPHFLFNSFNTLAAIIEDDTDAAVEYVENLSDFYRSILQYREKDLISLNEELDIIRNYRYLLGKRFGDSLRMGISVEENASYIAPLTLQLLVENAVKHNIITKTHPLSIQIFTDDDYLVVKNNVRRKSQVEKSTNYGLQSVVSRYHLMTQKPVKIEENETFFKVSIPLIKETKS